MKTVENCIYDIVDGNVVHVWEVGQNDPEIPFLIQPFDPRDGLPFTSIEDATEWVEQYIAERAIPVEPPSSIEE
jgi:hypothetical protein